MNKYLNISEDEFKYYIKESVVQSREGTKVNQHGKITVEQSPDEIAEDILALVHETALVSSDDELAA